MLRAAKSPGARFANRDSTMMHTSKIRRAAAILALGFIGGAHSADSTQSLDAIRKAAEEFVRSQIPGQPNTLEVAVGPLDERLRLAACEGPLQATLPAGATFRAKTTVAVTCRSGSRWTVYVPVSIATNVSVLILRHAALRGTRLSM